MRNVTTAMANELASTGSAGILPVLIAELQFDSGTLYMWSGVGDLVWNGNTYTGGGNLVGISAMEENQELQATGINVTLTGIPLNLVQIALTEQTRNRPFRLYLGCVDVTAMDSSGHNIPNGLIADPYRIFSGVMDVMKGQNDGQTATISLSVESTLLKGQRPNVSRYTDQDQRTLYPLDTGLSRINSLQDKEVVW